MQVNEAAGQPSDGELIARAASGDRDAFAQLYLRHHRLVYRFGRQMTGSSDMAEDIVQEVFIALMRNLAAYDPSRPLVAYLYGIARRMTRRRLQRARRVVSLDDAFAERSSSAAHREAVRGMYEAEFAADLERRDDVRLMRLVVTTLPPRYREVLVLCDLHKVSYELVAQAIGCAPGTIRSRLHRARRMVADRMQRLSHRVERLAPQTVRCTP